MEIEKTRDERIAELLEQSGSDAVGAIKGPSLSDIAPVEQTQTVETDPELEPEETPTGGKKVRIPQSRLKTLTSRIDQLEAELSASRQYQERVATLEAQLRGEQDDLPDFWKDAYGDNEVSRKAFKDQQRLMREEFTRLQAQQREQERAELEARNERVAQVEESFDTQMTELEETLGRELTDNQKSELLDIVGEYSPMEDGHYTAYMPIAKAYDIWQKTSGTNPSKQGMARIASLPSGNGVTESSPDRPLWGDWRKRFPG